MESTERAVEVIITEEDLLEALRTAQEVDLDIATGLSVEELSETLKRSRKWVRARLRKLKRAGAVDMVRRQQEAIDDRLIWVPTYVLRADSMDVKQDTRQ